MKVRSKSKQKKQLIDRDKSLLISRGKGGFGEVEEYMERISGDGRSLDSGW